LIQYSLFSLLLLIVLFQQDYILNRIRIISFLEIFVVKSQVDHFFSAQSALH
jgi:hypothetical protein